MKQSYSALPGVSLQSITLPAGNGIKGVAIDNDSGGWLYVVELRDWCPPYVHNWTRDMDYTGSAITVQYGTAPTGGAIVTGPSAQVVTNQGDGYTVTLYDSQVGYSNGTPENYIEQFTPVLSVSLHYQPSTAGTTAAFLPAVPGKRYRLLTVNTQLTNTGTGTPATDASSPVNWSIKSAVTNIILCIGAIGGMGDLGTPQTLPVDAPVGEGLNMVGTSSYAQGNGFVLTATYQLI